MNEKNALRRNGKTKNPNKRDKFHTAAGSFLFLLIKLNHAFHSSFVSFVFNSIREKGKRTRS